MTFHEVHTNAATPVAGLLQLDEIEDGLGSRRLNGKIHYFLELDSTNNQARQLAENGAAEGTMVIAEQQIRGRGRLGRHWVSPPYCNLYISLILRPTLPPFHAPQITLMAAVALADTVEFAAGAAPVIKWPNDILIDDKKLAGILTEACWSSQGLDFVVLGIGVNLNYPRGLMPETIRRRATSVFEVRHTAIRREAFVRRLIRDLDRCYGELEACGFAALAARWEKRFGLRGRKVRVDMLNDSVTGTATGIDPDGALIISRDDGSSQRILAGDVVPLEE